MTVESLLARLRQECQSMLTAQADGDDVILTLPMWLPDGDQLTAVLSRSTGSWQLHDEGAIADQVEAQGGVFRLPETFTERLLHYGAKVDGRNVLMRPVSEELTLDDVMEFVQAATVVVERVRDRSVSRRGRFAVDVQTHINRRFVGRPAKAEVTLPEDQDDAFPADVYVDLAERGLPLVAVPNDQAGDRAGGSASMFLRWGYEPLAVLDPEVDLSRRAMSRLEGMIDGRDRIVRLGPALDERLTDRGLQLAS